MSSIHQPPVKYPKCLFWHHRPLLTPVEVMQLPPNDEIVMLAGLNPVRAKKVRYYVDKDLQERILPPPKLMPATIYEQKPPDQAARNS